MPRSVIVFICSAMLCFSPAVAQEPPAATGRAQELIEREQVRAAVEAAMTLGLSGGATGAEELDNILRATQDLQEIGPAAVPYLINELDQSNPRTFHFCAFALGHFGETDATDAADAAEALTRALDRADRAPGDFALSRKGWAAYGLALLGRADAVDLVNEGQRTAPNIPIHGDTSVMEAAAILTAPASVPLLVAQLDRYAQREWWVERRHTLKALGRVLSAEAIPAVIQVLHDEDPGQRRAAAAALERGDGSAEAIEALLVAMADDDFRVRRAATLALEWIAPASEVPAALARLETENDAVVRGRIYRWIARAGAPGTLGLLRPFWPAADATDRFQFMTALELLHDPASIDILRQAVADPDNRVMSRAIGLAARLGTDDGIELVRLQSRSTVWARAQLCVEELIRNGDPQHGDVIARRLFGVELTQPVTDPRMRHRVKVLGEGLVALGYTDALDNARRQAETQPDIVIKRTLENVIERLEAEKRNKKRVKSWIEAAADENAEIRALAYRRLASLGGKSALAAIVSAFGRADIDEAVTILELLGGVDDEQARALIRRVLVDPAFDPPRNWPLREMAAWSARRLGGAEMATALRDAVIRRRGRDAHVLAYLLVLESESALDVLAEVRVPRMRFLKYTRGYEFDTFDRMAREIRMGRSLRLWDVPPAVLSFR